MKKLELSLLAAVTAACITAPICHADTLVVVAQNSAAATSNFGSPNLLNATTGYTIATSDDGTFYYTTLTAANPQGNLFANLYFYTGGDPSQASAYVGVEVTNSRAFPSGTSTYTSLLGTGYSESTTTNTTTGAVSIEAIIPNTFFLNDPLGLGFNKTPSGANVTLVQSQSFGYSVVGGAAPFYLGTAPVSPAVPVVTPEPATIEYMALAATGLVGALRRRFKRGASV